MCDSGANVYERELYVLFYCSCQNHYAIIWFSSTEALFLFLYLRLKMLSLAVTVMSLLIFSWQM